MIESKYSFDNYGVVEGTVKAGEKILATVTLQALRLNEDNKQLFFKEHDYKMDEKKQQLLQAQAAASVELRL